MLKNKLKILSINRYNFLMNFITNFSKYKIDDIVLIHI